MAETVNISVSIDTDLVSRLDALAETERRSRSKIVVFLIREALQGRNVGNEPPPSVHESIGRPEAEGKPEPAAES